MILGTGVRIALIGPGQVTMKEGQDQPVVNCAISAEVNKQAAIAGEISELC